VTALDRRVPSLVGRKQYTCDELQAAQIEVSDATDIFRLRDFQKLHPDARVIFPARSRVTVLTFHNFIEAIQRKILEDVCDRGVDSDQDFRAPSVGAHGVPGEHQRCSCQLRRALARQPSEPWQNRLQSQWTGYGTIPPFRVCELHVHQQKRAVGDPEARDWSHRAECRTELRHERKRIGAAGARLASQRFEAQGVDLMRLAQARDFLKAGSVPKQAFGGVDVRRGFSACAPLDILRRSGGQSPGESIGAPRGDMRPPGAAGSR
jgi:hypothetical protein